MIAKEVVIVVSHSLLVVMQNHNLIIACFILNICYNAYVY